MMNSYERVKFKLKQQVERNAHRLEVNGRVSLFDKIDQEHLEEELADLEILKILKESLKTVNSCEHEDDKKTAIVSFLIKGNSNISKVVYWLAKDE